MRTPFFVTQKNTDNKKFRKKPKSVIEVKKLRIITLCFSTTGTTRKKQLIQYNINE